MRVFFDGEDSAAAISHNRSTPETFEGDKWPAMVPVGFARLARKCSAAVEYIEFVDAADLPMLKHS